MRTGLGFIALGIAVERFSQLELSETLQSTEKLSRAESKRKQNQEQVVESECLIFILLIMSSSI